MTDNQSGSVSIQDRIESAITEVEETQPSVEVAEDQVEVEVDEAEIEPTNEDLDEIEAETDDAEDEPEEVQEAPSFESIDELAEALDMPVDQFLQNIKGKFKLNGEESEITLAELQAGYQKDADYRHKTAELAEQKRAFEAEREQVNTQVQEKLSQVDGLIENLNNQLLSEFQSVNWDDLRANDPGEYAARLQEFQGRQAQINQAQELAKSENERLTQEQQAKQAEQYQSYLRKEAEALQMAIPEWSNPDVAKAEKAELSEFLLSEGFSQDEVASAADHRIIKLAYKAMKMGKKAEKVDVTKNKVKNLPKLVKPGAKQNQQAQQVKKDKDLKRAIKKGDANALRSVLLSRV